MTKGEGRSAKGGLRIEGAGRQFATVIVVDSRPSPLSANREPASVYYRLQHPYVALTGVPISARPDMCLYVEREGGIGQQGHRMNITFALGSNTPFDSPV